MSQAAKGQAADLIASILKISTVKGQKLGN